MNVYTLKMKTTPSPDSSLEIISAFQRSTENKFRDVLRREGLADQFSRVSPPYKDNDMLMAVICSEAAAGVLQQQLDSLDVDSITYDKYKTRNLNIVTPMLQRKHALSAPGSHAHP